MVGHDQEAEQVFPGLGVCTVQNEEVTDGWVGLLHDQLSKFISLSKLPDSAVLCYCSIPHLGPSKYNKVKVPFLVYQGNAKLIWLMCTQYLLVSLLNWNVSFCCDIMSLYVSKTR